MELLKKFESVAVKNILNETKGGIPLRIIFLLLLYALQYAFLQTSKLQKMRKD